LQRRGDGLRAGALTIGDATGRGHDATAPSAARAMRSAVASVPVITPRSCGAPVLADALEQGALEQGARMQRFALRCASAIRAARALARFTRQRWCLFALSGLTRRGLNANDLQLLRA